MHDLGECRPIQLRTIFEKVSQRATQGQVCIAYTRKSCDLLLRWYLGLDAAIMFGYGGNMILYILLHRFIHSLSRYDSHTEPLWDVVTAIRLLHQYMNRVDSILRRAFGHTRSSSLFSSRLRQGRIEPLRNMILLLVVADSPMHSKTCTQLGPKTQGISQAPMKHVESL